MTVDSNWLVRSIAVAMLLALTGCFSPSDETPPERPLPEDPRQAVVVLRTELADRDAKLQSAEADLQRSTEEIRLLREEADRLQADLKRLREAAGSEAEFNVEKIVFGMLTGGADWDETRPGDDGLVAYVYPVDRHGDTVKRAGAFEITVFDLLAEDDHVLTRKSFDTPSNQQHWTSFPTACYKFRIPLRLAGPFPRKLVLRATFTDLTGRVFKATRDVTYRGEQKTE